MVTFPRKSHSHGSCSFSFFPLSAFLCPLYHLPLSCCSHSMLIACPPQAAAFQSSGLLQASHHSCVLSLVLELVLTASSHCYRLGLQAQFFFHCFSRLPKMFLIFLGAFSSVIPKLGRLFCLWMEVGPRRPSPGLSTGLPFSDNSVDGGTSWRRRVWFQHWSSDMLFKRLDGEQSGFNAALAVR